MSTTATTTPPPVNPLNKVSYGIYTSPETRDTLDGWKSPGFRTHGEVVTDMVRVLKAAGWAPGQGLFVPKVKK